MEDRVEVDFGQGDHDVSLCAPYHSSCYTSPSAARSTSRERSALRPIPKPRSTMRPPSLTSLALLIPCLTFSLAISVPQNYINTAIARTVELVGATTQITTQYNIKAGVDAPGLYHLALDGSEEPAWWEVTVNGKEVEGVRLLSASESG